MENKSLPKKKIGILSMQRVVNYGSFYQAYALKQIIKQNIECDVYFIDIEPGKNIGELYVEKNRLYYFMRIFDLLFSFSFIKNIKVTLFNRKLKNQFRDIFYPALKLDKKYDGIFDTVVIGSDEVFNFNQKTTWGYSKMLFGNGLNAKRIISYAASYGYATIQDVHKYGLVGEMTTNLSNFESISVRDKNSQSIVNELLGIEPLLHLDPVLIYGYKQEISQCDKPAMTDYIVIYTYQGRITDDSERDAIVSFAKVHNKRIVSIFCTYDWCDKVVMPEDVFCVFAWFKYADFVITDTFHGTIFSIITQQKFATIVRSTNRQKLTSLLDTLKLSSREYNADSAFEELYQAEIDYTSTNQVLEIQRAESISYLSTYVK